MVLSKKQYTLAATALGSSLAFIDATAVIVALPTMQKALHLGLTGEQWIFVSYSLALAALYLVGGALGDRYGHRKIFSRGIAGFALASALAGLAPSGAWLILARVLQGISGAFVTTNSLAWLRSVYGDEAGKAVGLWTSLTGVSTIIAPPLGGALTQWLSWRWIFYINLPLTALVLYWATRGVEDEPRDVKERPLDIPGSALIAIGLSFLTFFLVQGPKTGFGQLWWAAALGVLALAAFLVVEYKKRHPMLPLVLFKTRNFSAANLETFMIYGALYGVFVFFTLYLQFLGLSPLTSSLFLIPTSVILIALAAYFGALSDRRGPRLFLTIGPVLIGTGALMFSLISDKSQVWTIGSVGVAVFSFGLAMLVAPITTVALKSVSAKYAGIASGVNNTLSRIGSLTTIALAGMIISVIFFSQISNKNEVPLGLHQNSPALRQASHHGYQVGMWVVSGLAFAAAAVGWFGITNQQTRNIKD